MRPFPATVSGRIAAALLLAGASLAAGAVTLEDIQQRGHIRIAVANEIPYGYIDLDGQAKGAGPDVARQLMEQLGVPKIEWVPTAFSSLIPGLQARRYDMVAAEMAILPPRCRQVLFSDPNTSYGEGLLVAAGNPQNLHSYTDFVQGSHKVAIMAGADQLEILQKLGVPEDRMVTIAQNADAISTVATGRAAAYAATGLTVSELASKHPQVEAATEFQDPVVDGQPVRSWGGFTFARQSTGLRDAVNQALAEFRQTPAWTEILSRYGFNEADREGALQRSAEQLCAG